jgi:hypothetical protein
MGDRVLCPVSQLHNRADHIHHLSRFNFQGSGIKLRLYIDPWNQESSVSFKKVRALSVTGWARKGLGATLGQDSKIRWTSILFDLVRCRRTGQGSRGIRQSMSCMIFYSFSSSLSIRDELVESSSDSCNILPETVTFRPESFYQVSRSVRRNRSAFYDLRQFFFFFGDVDNPPATSSAPRRGAPPGN